VNPVVAAAGGAVAESGRGQPERAPLVQTENGVLLVSERSQGLVEKRKPTLRFPASL
jgi:hypothetical protein